MVSEVFLEIAYLVAASLFILGLKGLGSPKSAVRGNLLGAMGMLLAAGATFFELRDGNYSPHAHLYVWTIVAVVLGSIVGVLLAKRIKMTAMPELVAVFNGFGGLASAIVALGEVLHVTPHSSVVGYVTAFGILIGGLTFTGSVIAWGKLSGFVNSAPTTLPMQNLITGGLLLASVVSLVLFGNNLESTIWLWITLVLALALGVVAVRPIGGADMPVVIALLNSYSGIAASAAGYVLQNTVLLVAGALVGASGLILTAIMCKAMNRSLSHVLFSAFGTADSGSATTGEKDTRTVRNYTAEDGAILITSGRSVVVVPGYGMAVAQAQHAVKELADLLAGQGIEVSYAVHPVAGRMPGHMNVLLAEAKVPYDQLKEMDEVNPTFENVDTVLVIGANDVVNPAARDDAKSPLYGMPILEVDRARNVIILKRSLGVGFAGTQNELFFNDKTMMLFGDAKDTVLNLIQETKALA